VSSTRISISFTGRLSAAAQPVGAENVVSFLAASDLASGAWQAGGIHETIQTNTWTTLPWRELYGAEAFGLQVKAGPAVSLRLTIQGAEGTAIIPVSASFFCTFPEDARLVLAEIIGGSEGEASEFEWLAAGTVLPP
jgi:hypothetical protein